MSHYKERNYDTHWQMVKKTANLDDDLFKEDLSKKLNEQNKLFKKMMRAFGEDFDELYQAHGLNAVEIEKIVEKYRKIVNNNGANEQALQLLSLIDGNESGCMVWDMMLDKTEKYKALHPS